MNTELPKDIGGLQHLMPDVIAKADDVLVCDGRPIGFCHEWAGTPVQQVESGELCRVYRRIPVAKQGDIDTSGWKQVQCHAKPGDEKGVYPPVASSSDPETSKLIREALAGRLPTDAAKRKATPIYSGCIAYFPDAIAAVAQLSQIGNEQHNPGKPLHWDRSKSGDEADALMRHLLQKDEVDSDGVPHIVKVAWRGLAAAQKYLEARK